MPCPYCHAPGGACGTDDADDRTPICRWIEHHGGQVAQSERDKWVRRLREAAEATRESSRLTSGNHPEYPSDADAGALFASARLMLLADAYDTAALIIDTEGS